MAKQCGSLRALLAIWLLLYGAIVHALQLDLKDDASIKQAARTTLDGLLKYYNGNTTGVPGLLPDPYYWWEAGAMFGQMIEYWYYTGDDTYVDITTQAMLHQVGDANDYMPVNQTRTEGNDDQVFWAFAAMSAAELKYPDPPKDKPQWLALAQAVFNEQAIRWDTDSKTCNGGLRWQIFPFNKGYNYKNSISTGGFFQLAARLAAYTGNATYEEWADKAYNWISHTSLMSKNWEVFDGASTESNCTDAVPLQWTYNSGTFIAGSAYLYNHTNGTEKWRHRLEHFLKANDVFFPKEKGGNVMVEVACEYNGMCNVDQRSFKAYLARWLAVTTQLAPWTTDIIMPRLQASAKAAANQCSGGQDGVTCGRKWFDKKYDGLPGVGEQMTAMSVIQSNLVGTRPPPVGAKTGGTSSGDPIAGTGGKTHKLDDVYLRKMTAADKAGSAIITFLMVLAVVGTSWWMVTGDESDCARLPPPDPRQWPPAGNHDSVGSGADLLAFRKEMPQPLPEPTLPEGAVEGGWPYTRVQTRMVQPVTGRPVMQDRPGWI